MLYWWPLREMYDDLKLQYKVGQIAEKKNQPRILRRRSEEISWRGNEI